MVYGKPWATPNEKPNEESYARMRRREDCHTSVKTVLLMGLTAFAPKSTITLVGLKLAIYAYPDLANNTIAGYDTLKLYNHGDATIVNVPDVFCGQIVDDTETPTNEPHGKTESKGKEDAYSKNVGYRHRQVLELSGSRDGTEHDEL